MAFVIETPNPFKPHASRKFVLKRRVTIRRWLLIRFGRNFKEFAYPTIILVNGAPVMRAEWRRRKLNRGDIVNVIAQPGFVVAPWVLWTIIAVITAASVVVAITQKTSPKINANALPNADPVYSLKGKNNQEKLGNPIEVPYGLNRLYPSYAAQPYNQYIGNDQYLFQFFCLGQGEFDIAAVQIGDTPTSDFQDVSYEIVTPGNVPTLFPVNVVTSPDVAALLLVGTDQTGWAIMGPFILNAASTIIHRIEVDVSLPGGLYLPNNSGGLNTLVVTGLFEAQQIDASGAPIGSWFTIATFNQTLSTVDAQRFTFSFELGTPGRYQVRGRRTNAHATGTGASDKFQWDAIRGFFPDTTDYGDVTLIAVKARATNNLNDQSAKLINVICTRKLPIYDPIGGTWSVPTATRSPIWAFCDIMKATYGGRITDAFLALLDLTTLNGVYVSRSDCFDWVYDQSTTVWEAAKLLGLVGRAVPVLQGPVITMVRDALQTIPVGMFGPENMIKGSFQWQIKLPSFDYQDGLIVTYTDPDTYLQEVVDCLLPSDMGDNPAQAPLYGVAQRVQAYHEGMYQRAVQFLLRENIVFSTTLEGFIPTFGDLCIISCDIPRWAQAGLVTAAVNTSGTTWALTLNQAVSFAGGGTFKLALRYKNGTMKGPWTATAGADAQHITIVAADWPTDMPFDFIHEFPLFFFGTVSNSVIGYRARLIGIQPDVDDTVQLTFSNYDETVYSYDSFSPPAPGNTRGFLTPPPDVPDVTNLLVSPHPNLPTFVVASWDIIPGAQRYVVQLSYDGVAFTTISGDSLTANTLAFPVLPKFIYVRVAAINNGQGNWDYWTGAAPTSVPPIPGGFSAVAGVSKSVTLTWSGIISSQLFYYRISRNTVNSFSGATVIATIFTSNKYIDAPLATGTYYYFLEAVNYSGVTSGSSASVSAFVPIPPPDPSTPGTPSAPTGTTGTITDGTGNVFGYIDVTLPAFPSNTIMMQVLYKTHTAGASAWQVAAESLSGSLVIRISDLGVGVPYDVAIIAFDSYYTPSAMVTATGSPFTAAKSTSPNDPSSFSAHSPSSSFPIPPAYYPIGGVPQLLAGGTFTFADATDKDIIGYEWAAQATHSAPSGSGQFVPRDVGFFTYYASFFFFPMWMYMRSKDSSGNFGGWVDTGINAIGACGFPAGNMSEQDSSGVGVTQIKTGSSGINVNVLTQPNVVLGPLAGGSSSETFYMDISSWGFSHKPDAGEGGMTSNDPNVAWAYNWDDPGNSSANAAIVFTTLDRSALPGGGVYRLQPDFKQTS